MHGHSTDQEKAPREVARRADDSATGWQTPEYAIVDTALEVTAYRLADR
ncbi:pyrroloquinoline quinone precursor peptide PqqA [Streptomyces sp. NPDC004732]